MLFPKGKKAQESGIPADNIPFLFIFMFLIPLLILAFFFIGNLEHKTQTYVPEPLSEYLIEQKFLESTECFVTYDPITGKGAIDLARFNSQQLDLCYPAKAGDRAVRLNFKDIFVQSSNWDDNRPQSLRFAQKTVTILNGTKTFQASFTVEIQEPSKNPKEKSI